MFLFLFRKTVDSVKIVNLFCPKVITAKHSLKTFLFRHNFRTVFHSFSNILANIHCPNSRQRLHIAFFETSGTQCFQTMHSCHAQQLCCNSENCHRRTLGQAESFSYWRFDGEQSCNLCVWGRVRPIIKRFILPR